MTSLAEDFSVDTASLVSFSMPLLSLILRLAVRPVPSNPSFYPSLGYEDVDPASLAQLRLQKFIANRWRFIYDPRHTDRALKEELYVQDIARFAGTFPGLEENCKMLHLRKQGWEQRELSPVSGH
jgi:hypothetical protein